MNTREEKQLIIAESRVIEASKTLESWFKEMLKNKVFTTDEMSVPELDFMEAVKELRKAQRQSKKYDSK